MSTQSCFSRHPIATFPFVSRAASTALCTRLINSCSSCAASARIFVTGLDTTFTFSLGSRFTTRCTRAASSTSRFCGGGSFVRRVYACRNRPSESARDAMEFNPLRASSRQSGGGGSRRRRDSKLAASDLIGASELFISWPSTRTNRCQARRSSSRSVRLRSVSTSRSCGRPSSRNVLRRTPQRPEPPGKLRVSGSSWSTL